MKVILTSILCFAIAIFALYSYFTFNLPAEGDLIKIKGINIIEVEEKQNKKNGIVRSSSIHMKTDMDQHITLSSANAKKSYSTIVDALANTNNLVLYVWKESDDEPYDTFVVEASNRELLSYEVSCSYRSSEIVVAKYLGLFFLIAPVVLIITEKIKSKREQTREFNQIPVS